jgi:hypothetical protein
VAAYVVIGKASINIFVRRKMWQMKHISACIVSISTGTNISLTALPFVEPKI